MFQTECSYCGTTFERAKSPNQDKAYCSKSCSNRAAPRRKPQGSCHTCQVPIPKTRKCCPKCYVLFLRTRPKQNNDEVRSKMNKLVSDRIRKLKQMGVEFLGSKCVLCGYDKCVAALDFHHVDPATKEFNLSGKSICWERFKKELLKCVILCATCHREVEYGFSLLPPEVISHQQARHYAELSA